MVAAILVLLGGGYALYKGMTRAPAASGTPPSAQVASSTVKEESDSYTIDLTYPQFGIPAIDADIKSKIDIALQEFKTLPANPPESATPKNEFTGTFEDVYIGPDIISAKLILSQYTGGAHPMTIFSGVNYDRATGRQILPRDAFAMVGLSLNEISAKATTELKTKLADSMFEEGANSNPENFSSFVISVDKVTFIFQPYQVAPYAAGPQEVSFERVK